MKKLALSITAIFLMMTSFSTLHAQELRNGSGNSTGKIDSDGTIRNGSGNSVGKIDSD
jgi:hypothetical protein